MFVQFSVPILDSTPEVHDIRGGSARRVGGLARSVAHLGEAPGPELLPSAAPVKLHVFLSILRDFLGFFGFLKKNLEKKVVA